MVDIGTSCSERSGMWIVVVIRECLRYEARPNTIGLPSRSKRCGWEVGHHGTFNMWRWFTRFSWRYNTRRRLMGDGRCQACSTRTLIYYNNIYDRTSLLLFSNLCCLHKWTLLVQRASTNTRCPTNSSWYLFSNDFFSRRRNFPTFASIVHITFSQLIGSTTNKNKCICHLFTGMNTTSRIFTIVYPPQSKLSVGRMNTNHISPQPSDSKIKDDTTKRAYNPGYKGL
jgi:hypothetical protein